ncbi:MAG: ABC-F family ATP-binding cassette domain-containing protein [Saprospiraceae bacterium]
MLTLSNVALQYGKRVLFKDVDLKFTRGNCYGIIGANGAGKSTLLKIMSGDISPQRGDIVIEPGNRMAVLRQDQAAYDDYPVLEAVLIGHSVMYKMGKEKDAIYMDPDASEKDMLKAADMEQEFGEMGGWEAESNAASLLSKMGVAEEHHHRLMSEMEGPIKVKVLLAQALFGEPELLLLDEPTNDLDADTVHWLSDYLADFKNTVIVVSHDRYFLDMVCTHIVDIDYQQASIYTGNYTFWQATSELAAQQAANKNKKTETKRAELIEFIQRFSANASKSKQATSRKKALEKLNIDEIKPSSRKYPYIAFNPEREPGDQLLKVENLSANDVDGNLLFGNVSFQVNTGDKIGVLSSNSNALAAFYEVLSGRQEPLTGTFSYGQTITQEYLPSENHEYFEGQGETSIMEWLRQYSENKDEQFIRGFLGRMLFGGEEVHKSVEVLSGGEKVRCMMSKAMLGHPNFVLLNEPTNHLDLESITALNNSLTDFKGNLIMSSHDHQLVQTVVNRVIEIGPNGQVDYLGTLEEYLASEKRTEARETLYPADASA